MKDLFSFSYKMNRNNVIYCLKCNYMMSLILRTKHYDWNAHSVWEVVILSSSRAFSVLLLVDKVL